MAGVDQVKQAEKVWSNRLRRMASRQGLVLHKSRRRDPRALDFGRWTVLDRRRKAEIARGSTLEGIERFLNGEFDRQTAA